MPDNPEDAPNTLKIVDVRWLVARVRLLEHIIKGCDYCSDQLEAIDHFEAEQRRHAH